MTTFDALLEVCKDHYRANESNENGMPLQGDAAVRQVIDGRVFTEKDVADLLLGAIPHFAEHSDAGLYGWNGLLRIMLKPYLVEAMKLEMGPEYDHIREDRFEKLMEGRPRSAE